MKKYDRVHLPALRCHMGDWIYYVAAMRMSEVAGLISEVKDVHKSEKLCEWIQRQIEDDHAVSIADYLLNVKSRFFGALVVGVYGGQPQWSNLKVNDPRDVLTADEETRLNETVGVLTLTGGEKLFPIDGQHRVAGIKKALKASNAIGDEEVSVLLLGHSRSPNGLARTRSLFVTLNQRARKVSDRDLVALSEDNGLAVVARRMIDDFDVFQSGGIISFSKTVGISEREKDKITSILGVYQIVKALYPRSRPSWPKKNQVLASRPSDEFLETLFEENCAYWNGLIAESKEIRTVLKDGRKQAEYFRQLDRNHLLFRPAGQLAFARAVECLMSRGFSMTKAIKQLLKSADVWLHNQVWHSILWDPVRKSMLKEVAAAETLLLRFAGQEARSERARQRLVRIETEKQQ